MSEAQQKVHAYPLSVPGFAHSGAIFCEEKWAYKPATKRKQLHESFVDIPCQMSKKCWEEGRAPWLLTLFPMFPSFLTSKVPSYVLVDNEA